MDPKLRRVGRLPLKVLWDENGEDLNIRPAQELGGDAIRELLRSLPPVPFVVVNLVDRPRWIRGDERFEFWKTELRPHLAEPSTPGHRLEDFPNEYFYRATEWRWEGEDAPYCIVCQLMH